MEAFATPEDLKLIWPGYVETDRSRAEALLLLISSAISALVDTSEKDADVLKLVTCRVVSRAMQADTSQAGVTQESWSASPYGGSVTFANPSGDVYLTAFEKSLLGIGESSAVFVNQEVPGSWPDPYV